MCYVSWTYFGFYPGSSKYSWHCEPVILELKHFPLTITRSTIQTPLTLSVSFPLPGGTSSPSLSTCSTHFSLSPGTHMTKVCFKRCNFFCILWRKKYSHVSALHVIHHSTLPWLSWWGPKWVLALNPLPQKSVFSSKLNDGIKGRLWWCYEISSYVHRFVGGGQAAFGPFLNSGSERQLRFISSHGCQESTLWCTSTTSAPHSVRGCNLTSGGKSISPPYRSLTTQQLAHK